MDQLPPATRTTHRPVSRLMQMPRSRAGAGRLSDRLIPGWSSKRVTRCRRRRRLREVELTWTVVTKSEPPTGTPTVAGTRMRSLQSTFTLRYTRDGVRARVALAQRRHPAAPTRQLPAGSSLPDSLSSGTYVIAATATSASAICKSDKRNGHTGCTRRGRRAEWRPLMNCNAGGKHASSVPEPWLCLRHARRREP